MENYNTDTCYEYKSNVANNDEIDYEELASVMILEEYYNSKYSDY